MIMTLYSHLSCLSKKSWSEMFSTGCGVSFLFCFPSAWNSISNLLAIKLNPPMQCNNLHLETFIFGKFSLPVNQIGFICRYNFYQSSLGICSKLPVLPRLNLKHSINFMSWTSQSTIFHPTSCPLALFSRMDISAKRGCFILSENIRC